MKKNVLFGLLWFASNTVAIPGGRLWRRQTSSPADVCTCPSNGLVTTTVVEYRIVTSSSTITSQGGTIFSTGSAKTTIMTSTSTSIVTVVTGTTTIVRPGVTETTTAETDTTSIITKTVTQNKCPTAVPKMVKRQATTSTSNSATDTSSTPPIITFTSTISSRKVTCTCTTRPRTTTLAGTSSCSCPETTISTVTVSSTSSGVVVVTVFTETPTVVVITPTEMYTTTIESTSTYKSIATKETTQSSLTVTRESLATVFDTVTTTVFTCTDTSTSSSKTSSTRVQTSPAAVPSQAGSFACNSTAYYITTVSNSITLYNIDLATGQTIVFARNVGGGGYTTMNGMGFNSLDNYLYAIATISSGNYAVVRLTTAGGVQEILRFTASADPGNVGDFDDSGQFYFSGGGTSWYQMDLAPGSSKYGTIVASGTSTLTGYNLKDWAYLGGEGPYMWALAQSSASSPTYAMLKWSLTAHTWSTVRTYPSEAASNPVIAAWGGNNGTLWGFAATTGKISAVDAEDSVFKAVSTGQTGITAGDGARCAFAS